MGDDDGTVEVLTSFWTELTNYNVLLPDSAVIFNYFFNYRFRSKSSKLHTACTQVHIIPPPPEGGGGIIFAILQELLAFNLLEQLISELSTKNSYRSLHIFRH